MNFFSHMRQCEVSDHNLPGALDLQPYGFLLQLHTATVYKRKLNQPYQLGIGEQGVYIWQCPPPSSSF